MRVMILRDWRNCVAGREMEIPDGMANELIRRKIAERYTEVQCAMRDNSKYQTAMINRTPKKRG